MSNLRTKLVIENPGDVELSLTLTMKANDWTRLRDQLRVIEASPWPLWQVRDLIGESIDKANVAFRVSDDARPTESDPHGCAGR